MLSLPVAGSRSYTVNTPTPVPINSVLFDRLFRFIQGLLCSSMLKNQGSTVTAVIKNGFHFPGSGE
jgi:hypothetical protein